MFKHPILFFLIVFSSPLYGQEITTDLQQISKTVDNYFDGYVNRNIEKLNLAFDTENGAMKVYDKSENGMETVENAYFKNLIPKWASKEPLPKDDLSKSALEILNIDVVEGKMATAKISMKVGEATYIDILSLQKVNQAWKITNKMFVVMDN